MKIREIILEQSYANEISTSVSDFLASAKARGVTELPTSKLVSSLRQLGHNVNVDSIMLVLGENPFVKSATKDTIQLDDNMETELGANVDDQNKELVSQMAQKSLSKG